MAQKSDIIVDEFSEESTPLLPEDLSGEAPEGEVMPVVTPPGETGAAVLQQGPIAPISGDWQPKLPGLGAASLYLPRSIEEQVDVEPEEEWVGDNYLLLDLSDRRIYLYENGEEQVSYPVAIGRDGWETPTGLFVVMRKERYPLWRNPYTNQIVGRGPDNPLGVRWIGFWSDGNSAIGFHGTPHPHLIGQAVSHGCVRMHNRDVVKLYEQVEIGMPVKVID